MTGKMQTAVVRLLLVGGVFVTTSAGLRAEPGPGPQWELVFEEQFNDPQTLGNWLMEGAGRAEVTDNGRLQITNIPEAEGSSTARSVFWHKAPFWGDLRIEFACRAEPNSRAIVFFNARATHEGQNLFAWQRPQADYADYAYEPRLELYSLGLLRSDQPHLNLRYLGRDIPEAWMELMPYHPMRFPAHYLEDEQIQTALAALGVDGLPETPEERYELTQRGPFPALLASHVARWEEVNDSFQEASIIADHTADTPVFSDPEKWYQVSIEAVGPHIRVRVDDEMIFDHSDQQRQGRPLRGGYIGFRNFRPTTVWYDNLRIYRKVESSH